jgi:putative cardiolipin synthase
MNFADLDVVVIGPVVKEVSSQFDLYWNHKSSVPSADQTDTHLAPQLREVVGKTKNELFLVSPYFVPGKEGVELLSDARKRDVRLVVITNSLASLDEWRDALRASGTS